MPTIASSQVPPPRAWDEFEEIVLSAAKLRWDSTDFFRQGRQGQRQDGVDVFGHDKSRRSIGVQAKNTIGGVTKAVAVTEITNAGSFQPKLDALYIATSAPTDAPTQQMIRELSQAQIAAGSFPVEILFWNDVIQDLAKDDGIFFKHFPQFRGETPQAHDRKLFDQVLALLTSDGVIGFIDKNNMAGFSFEANKLDPLWEFYESWDAPERHFLNQKIDSARKALRAKIGEYHEVVVTNVSYTNMPGRVSVPADWEITNPTRFFQVVKELHDLAGEIVQLHADFVRVGKAELIGS